MDTGRRLTEPSPFASKAGRENRDNESPCEVVKKGTRKSDDTRDITSAPLDKKDALTV
jgi:hypothetical protein